MLEPRHQWYRSHCGTQYRLWFPCYQLRISAKQHPDSVFSQAQILHDEKHNTTVQHHGRLRPQMAKTWRAIRIPLQPEFHWSPQSDARRWSDCKMLCRTGKKRPRINSQSFSQNANQPFKQRSLCSGLPRSQALDRELAWWCTRNTWLAEPIGCSAEAARLARERDT